ncbi:MAG: hypothetical protein JNK56_03455 [Myxococcales bacterium]|nr:hypothetical protein [Myxococcales bacterium]
MRYLLLTTAFLLLACDDMHACPESARELVIVPPAGSSVQPELAFREQGPPHASYIETWDGKTIHAEHFAAAAVVCSNAGDPPLLLTLSSYDPDLTVSNDRVVGLGASMVASDDLFECLTKVWANNDATELLP